MTLRKRVTLALIALAIAILPVGGLSMLLISNQLHARIDKNLTEGPFAAANNPNQIIVRQERNPCGLVQVADAVVVVADESARVLPGCQTDNTPTIDFTSFTDSSDSTVNLLTATNANGVTYRMRIIKLSDGYLAFGLSLADTNATIRRVAIIHIATGLTLLLGVGLIASWLLRSGLRPLGEIARTADLIAAGDRSRRIDIGSGADDEVGRVGRALNGMLDEVDRSFASVHSSMEARAKSEERLRQFVQDASHELRTPLTSIQGYAELYESGAVRDPEAVNDLMTRVRSESHRMSRLVSDLLRLANLDAEPGLVTEESNLAKIAESVISDAAAIDTQWPVELVITGSSSAVVDPQAIHQVLANLLANVRAHTPSGTLTTVTIAETKTGVDLIVADNGPGIEKSILPEIFERFVRADESRSRHSGGAGLGLSIVRSIIEAHGGTVTASNATPHGAVFHIRLPRD